MTEREALEILKNERPGCGEKIVYTEGEKCESYDMAISALEKQSQIVHCKNCIHWGTEVPGETECVKCCEYGRYMVGENGFCCYGEREKHE